MRRRKKRQRVCDAPERPERAPVYTAMEPCGKGTFKAMPRTWLPLA